MDDGNISIGTDIEENRRFAGKTIEKDEPFLRKIFTQAELDYCFSKGVPSQHLCARYCAKEAVVKALYGLNIKDVYYSDIEILHNENKVPYIVIKKYPNLSVKISLSHSKDYSCANALVIKE